MAEQPFRDAEAWLAERGVRRDPLRVEPTGEPESEPAPAPDGGSAPPSPPHPADASPANAPPDGPDTATPSSQEPSPGDPPPMSARQAVRLAQASVDEHLRSVDERAGGPDRRSEPRLEDDVAEAVAFVRRSTANAPQAEGRLATKLAERGWSSAVIEAALQRCRASGLVDDAALAAALVEEGRRKGHAPTRLRADLRRRELPEDVIERVLTPLRDEDPEAAAFAVARQKADTLTGVDAETAFRRIVGHLARRGHPEALARKVARAAVFDARDPERTASR